MVAGESSPMDYGDGLIIVNRTTSRIKPKDCVWKRRSIIMHSSQQPCQTAEGMGASLRALVWRKAADGQGAQFFLVIAKQKYLRKNQQQKVWLEFIYIYISRSSFDKKGVSQVM